jgi:hypothetical protein
MDHYAGIDVSLECSSVCVVEANGKIVREHKVASEPEAQRNPGTDKPDAGPGFRFAQAGLRLLVAEIGNPERSATLLQRRVQRDRRVQHLRHGTIRLRGLG